MDNQSTNEPQRTFGDFVACGFLFLGAPSLLAIVLILVLLAFGTPSPLIEKGMVWLSVPWFAFCYALCKAAHGTKVVIVNSDGNPIEAPPQK